MRVTLVLAALALTGACAHLPEWAGGRPREAPSEQLFRQAMAHLDTTGREASLDSAVYYLDRYLVSSHRLEHGTEAVVLRRLARDAQELRRVETLLRQARTEGARTETRGGDVEPRRAAENDASVREIQRLKDELAKANAELERIRKRLANPRKP